MVLDAGALIALERRDRNQWRLLRGNVGADVDTLVPVGALAQAWRGGARQAQLVQALRLCTLASFDDIAHDAGALCGATGTSDVVDASVALTAARRGATVLCTSDPDKLETLLLSLGAERVRIIAC